MLCAEVSIYPQNNTNANQVVNDAISKMSQQSVRCKVGSVSTHLDGNDEQVWQSIKSAWESAKSSGEVSMVVTLTNTTTH